MLDELRAELAFAQRLPERRPGPWDKLPAYLDALRSRIRELETIGD